MISVICVYSDKTILNDWLLAGLKGQTREYELITVDNTSCAFRSAAAALNYGAGKAKGDCLMFVHQDVRLLSGDWLEKAESFLRTTPGLGAAGAAGMIKTRACGIMKVGTIPEANRVWVVYHGREKEADMYDKALSGSPAEVQTLDEQLILVPAKVFSAIKFDEAACPGWHMYGVDYALSVRKYGLKAYVLPLPVWHLSKGTMNGEYYTALENVIAKHRGEKKIYTTCGLWYASRLLNLLFLLLLAARSEAGRWLGRNDTGGKPSMDRLKFILGIKR
jgi:hypothetical protein